MAFITTEFRMSWLNHDSWSESFVGVRRIAYEILPSLHYQQSAEDSALCQLALVGASQLMEVALFELIRPHIGAQGTTIAISQSQFDDASYWKALSKWVQPLTGRELDLTAEPFASTERLRRRRNETVHKCSALASVEMARSALFSAVEGSRSLYNHFGSEFKYTPFLKQYPIPIETWFSSVAFP